MKNNLAVQTEPSVESFEIEVTAVDGHLVGKMKAQESVPVPLSHPLQESTHHSFRLLLFGFILGTALTGLTMIAIQESRSDFPKIQPDGAKTPTGQTQLMKQFDKNRDGKLSKEELIHMNIKERLSIIEEGFKENIHTGVRKENS